MDEPTSTGENVATVVENVVDEATAEAERKAREAQEAARAIAESAIVQEQQVRFQQFQAENERWRGEVQQTYEQRLAEATTPLREAMARLTAALEAKPPEPVTVLTPSPSSTPEPSPAVVNPEQVTPEAQPENGAGDGLRENPVANPEPEPRRSRFRLI